MTFEDWVAECLKLRLDGIEWKNAVEGALEALAAERAEARLPAGAPIRFWPPDTAYDRAMTTPRMGGQHPHDGRHIMSMRHWGMV